jgi:hypothetical protein
VDSKSAFLVLITQFAARLRYPQLFFVTAVIFVLDLVIPDMIPFVDEILLGLLTVLFGALKKKRSGPVSATHSDERHPG